MKNPISNLQKVFESRIRLGIMSALMVNDTLDFNALKELLERAAAQRKTRLDRA